MFSLPVCVHVTSSRMPFAAAQAIERCLMRGREPAPAPVAANHRQPVLALRRFVRPAHQARVADDLPARERDERPARQRRLLGQPAVDSRCRRPRSACPRSPAARAATPRGGARAATRSTRTRRRRSREGPAAASSSSSSTCFTSRRVSSKPKRRAKAIERSSAPATCEPARSNPRSTASSASLVSSAVPTPRPRLSGSTRGAMCAPPRSDRFMRPLPASSPSRSASR